MESKIKISTLSEVKPFKYSWRVAVKVIHKWNSFSHQKGASLEMVLGDKNVRNPYSLSSLSIHFRYYVYAYWFSIWFNLVFLYDLIGYQNPCHLQTFPTGTIREPICCWRMESYYQLFIKFSIWYESTYQPCLQNGVVATYINNGLWFHKWRQHVSRSTWVWHHYKWFKW